MSNAITPANYSRIDTIGRYFEYALQWSLSSAETRAIISAIVKGAAVYITREISDEERGRY